LYCEVHSLDYLSRYEFIRDDVCLPNTGSNGCACVHFGIGISKASVHHAGSRVLLKHFRHFYTVYIKIRFGHWAGS
jgi:hypothetical protein